MKQHHQPFLQLCRRSGFLLLAGGLWLAAQSGPAAPTNDFIDGRELRDLIAGELKERLARSERLTLLPHNLSGVHVVPGRSPVFAMPGDSPSAATNLAAAVESYGVDYGSFRLVQGAEVMGLSEKEIVLVSSPSGRIPRDKECAIVGGTGARRLVLPARLGVTGVARTFSGWGFRCAGGIVVPDDTNSFQNHLPAQFQEATVFPGSNAVTYIANAEGQYPNPDEVCLAQQDARGICEQRFKLARRGMQGAVRLKDGRWLLIAEKITPLREDSVQPEEIMASVLQAARDGDRSAFLKGLENASVHPPDALAGLCRLLSELHGKSRGLQEIQSRTENLLESLPDKTRAGTNEALNKTLAEIRRGSEQFLDDLDAIAAGTLGIPPARAAALMREGYQFLDGRWISGPRLVGQAGPDSAELEVFFLDASRKPRRGIFHLDDGGHLTLLADCGTEPKPRDLELVEPEPREPEPSARSDSPGNVVPEESRQATFQYAAIPLHAPPTRHPLMCFKSADGQDLVFYPYFGLARMAQGKLEWLDRSPEFKSVREVVGLDNEGRIYFRSGPRDEWHPTSNGAPRQNEECFWVYRLKEKPAAPRLKFLFPVQCEPAMDSSNHLWFLAKRTVDPLLTTFGSLADNTMVVSSARLIRSATNRWLSVSEWPIVSRNRFDITTDLYSFSNGQLFRRMTNLPPHTRLLPGPTGGILGLAQTRGGAFIIDEQGAVARTNLHELARRDFGRLLAVAPTRNPAPDIFVPKESTLVVDGHSAVFRLGSFLCVSHEGKLEAYGDGQPLDLSERLTKLSPGNLAGLLVFAPLTCSNRPAALLYFTGYRNQHPRVIWAIAGEENINLVPGEQPESFFQEADYRRRHDINVMNVGGPPDYMGRDQDKDRYTMWSKHLGPVMAGSGEKIFFPKSAEQILEVSGPDQAQVLDRAGTPVLAMQSGGLIVHRDGPPYQGYRLCSGENRRDIRPTFSHSLRVLKEEADGTLLCCSPEGLAWLRRGADGDYAVDKEIRLGLADLTYSVAGETATELYLTLVDRTAWTYLAIIEK